MPKLLVARVGFDLLRGLGGFLPSVMRGDWPLGRLSLSDDALRLSALLFGTVQEIPWRNVASIRGTWTGMVVEYCDGGEQRTLCLFAPFLWHRLQLNVARHALNIVRPPTATRHPSRFDE